MRKRRKLNKRKSKRLFRSKAGTHKRNMPRGVMRGGTRL